jgi:hypothetical protein
MRIRQRYRVLAMATAVLSGAFFVAPMASATSASRPYALPRPASPAGPADEIVAGVGSTDGYRVFVARSADGWSWQPIALLDPGGYSDQAWVGNTCLTGDGSTAVAVIAPWSTINSPAGIEHGGLAYAVNLATGQTRVLATALSMAYFDPGCGRGHDVALTSYLGDSEQATRVEWIDAASGTVGGTVTLSGEFTSAVPVSGGLMAAHGAALVRLARTHATSVARLPGQVFDLRPNRQGGVDLLSADSATAGTAWRFGAGVLRRVGAGPLGKLALYSGHAGATVLFGGTSASAIPGMTARAGTGARVLATSQLGRAALTAPPKGADHASSWLPQIVSSSGKVLRQAATPPGTWVTRTTAATVQRAGTATSRAASAPPATPQSPKCAVGRDNPVIQVPQPSNSQVDWAIQHAVTNTLPSRPAGFDNLPGGTYSPESDFPQPALTGGSSHVPALVVAGILAQESNFNQASWHAAGGSAGDPLIADYYGNGGSSSFIDYSSADCGYGIGQITDIMNAGNSIGLTIQQRVAVDYSENIAATVQHLAATWNQLAGYRPAITISNNDPQWLENWYATIWAYNSGVEPRDASFGLPSGCTAPGPPSCTDSAGNWGLGWSNNPINPIYPPGRPIFLSNSYADAATPQLWPYQEKVFGWMATPLLRYSASYGQNVAAYPTNPARYLAQAPETDFCSTTVDHCNPSDPAKLYCGYQASGPLQYHCWWHGPDTFADCANGGSCTPDLPVSTNSSEPAALNPAPPVCKLDTSQVPISTPAGPTIVVTEESGPANPGQQDINVVGCTGNLNWKPAGTFSLSYATDSQGDPLGQVDLHQLGAGFGGHLFFTHTVPQAAASTNQVVGTWTPGITSPGIYQVKVFVPNIGAVADPAVYTITSSNGSTSERTITQNSFGNQWVSLGDFALSANASVTLTNVTANGDYASDLAYAAMAFIPRGGRLVNHTIDGFSIFSPNQSLNGSVPPLFAGDFQNNSTLISMANNLTNGLLAYPACPVGTENSSCVPAPVLAAMTSWQSAVTASNGHPGQWLAFSNATPPSPLPPGYLDVGTNYKTRATVNVDFVVKTNGQIDPSSYTVTATNATGITEIPQFILDMFSSIQSGYGISEPNLAYSAQNLEYFNGASIAVNPLGGVAPGREYMPDLSVQLTSNNTCLLVQDLAGGADGWKTLLTQDNPVNDANSWKNSVDDLVNAGSAPQALSNLADTVTRDFFTRPLVGPFNLLPWPPSGSPFYFAPPIWVEDHFNDCVTGSTDTITPAGNVDPVTNKAQLIDISYMPDLYLAIDGQYVDKYGKPNGGAPVQTGDWYDFSWTPLTNPYPGNDPWNSCYIGPTTKFADGSTIYFISRRDGNPWNLALLTSPNDLSSSVRFC